MPEAKTAPQVHGQAQVQDSKLKKIEWYASHLISEAVMKEKAGRLGDATADYLQAADLLLLLAKGQENYTAWKSFTDKAMSCQQRVRALIATRKQKEATE